MTETAGCSSLKAMAIEVLRTGDGMATGTLDSVVNRIAGRPGCQTHLPKVDPADGAYRENKVH